MLGQMRPICTKRPLDTEQLLLGIQSWVHRLQNRCNLSFRESSCVCWTNEVSIATMTGDDCREEESGARSLDILFIDTFQVSRAQ